MSIISGYEEQLKLCSNFTCSLSTPPWCACCLHAHIQYHRCIDKGKPDRGERQKVCQEFPTAKGCQHPTSNAANNIPESTCPSHLSTPDPETSRKVSTVEAACPTPPPLQPPYLSIPSFHHVWQKSYLLCFHGCYHELFNIKGLFLQIQSSL